VPTSNTATYEWWVVSKVHSTAPLGSAQEITEVVVMRRRDLQNLDFDGNYATMVGEGALPAPDGEYGVANGTFMEGLRCRGITAEKIDSAHIRITVRWSSLYADSGPGQTSTGLWLPASTEYSTRLRPMQTFRRAWSTSPSNVDESAEIGGVNISSNGEPITQEVPQLQLRVRQTFDSSVTAMISSVAPNVDLVGRLNNNTFYGFVAGTVLCEGITCTKIDGMQEHYELVVDFLYDQFFHLSQVAECDVDGRMVLVGPAFTPPGVGPKTVKWKRINRNNADFNTVFSTNQYRLLAQNGWWP